MEDFDNNRKYDQTISFSSFIMQKRLLFLVIDRLQNWCGDALFLNLPTGKYEIHCISGDQISHIQIMVAKRGLTNRANGHAPM